MDTVEEVVDTLVAEEVRMILTLICVCLMGSKLHDDVQQCCQMRFKNHDRNGAIQGRLRQPGSPNKKYFRYRDVGEGGLS